MLDGVNKHQRLINLVAWAAVIVALGRTILLAKTEVVPFGAEVGELLYDSSLAYATAWLFQWLVIVRPERARRTVSNRIVATFVYDLVRPGRSLVATLRASTGRQGTGWPPRADDLRAMCAAVQPSKTPKGQLMGNWWRYLEHIYNQQVRAQRGLEPFYHRMDEELLGLVRDERESGLILRQFSIREFGDPRNPSLDAFANDLSNWLASVEALREYHDRVLAPGRYTPDDPY